MKELLDLPVQLRLAAALAIGVCMGAVVNWAVYSLAYQRRWISPWSRIPSDDAHRLAAGPSRRFWYDRLPIIGWLALRRESSLHGPRFWIRPLLVELGFGLASAGLYCWEVHEQSLIKWMGVRGALMGMPPWPELSFFPPADALFAMHALWLTHMALAAFMLAASLIDIDERTIPDAVTVPGTLLGLTLAAVYPWTRLPADVMLAGWPPAQYVDFLKATSPILGPWPTALGARPDVVGLTIALTCYMAWIFVLLPRPWYPRHGVGRALRVSWARMVRGLLIGQGLWRPVLLLFVGGAAAIFGVWYRGDAAWISLVSALLGVVVGGGMVWLVRQIGRWTMRREAMGLGDVTLMAMIGSFVGWQPCLLIFFVAPVFALVHGVIQLAWLRRGDLFYGPFLCLATATVILRWDIFWDRSQPMFELGWFVPAILSVGFVLMALMLAALQWLKSAIR